MFVPPGSPFSSLSLESPISNAAEGLDRSTPTQASANLAIQAVCPHQLLSTTLLQRLSQPSHQLGKYLPSNLRSENTSQSKKKHSSF